MNNYISTFTNYFPQNLKKIIENHLTLFVSFVVTIISCIFYSLGYLFIYGFYFSGVSARRYSLFDIIINPIPLDFKSTIVIAVLFLISVILFRLIVKSFKINKVLTLFIFIGVHFLLAVIFIGFGNDNDFQDILLFCLVWVLPFLVYQMISFSKELENTGSLIIISSICYAFNLTILNILILVNFNILHTYYSWCYISFVLLLFLTPKILKLIIAKIKYQAGVILICFSIINLLIVIITGIIFYLIKSKLSITQFIFFMIISLVIASVFSILMSRSKFFINNSSINTEIPNSKSNLEIFKNLTNKNRYLSIIILISVMLLCFSICFYGSIILGHIVRMSILNIPSDLIKYTSCGKTCEIRGIIVCKKDGIGYISTEDFNLKTVNIDGFEVTDILSIKDEIKSFSNQSWLNKVNYSNIFSTQLDDDSELELILFLNQKLLLIDRDHSGIKNTCFLADIDNFSVNNKIINVSTNKVALKYHLLNDTFKVLN